VRVETDGIAQFINRLEKFDKDISKTLKKELRAAAMLTAKNARGRISGTPLSGWGPWKSSGRDLSFAVTSVRSGFTVATNRYRRRGVTVGFGYDVVQKSAAGSIFETVGKSTGTPFVDAITARFSGARPRTLLPAYYSTIEEAQTRIGDAVARAEREVGL
jgi:hypothetical protein